MKKALIILTVLLATINSFGQNVSGPWYGALAIPGMQLRLTFDITKVDTGYTATMVSIDQDRDVMPFSSVKFSNSILKLTMSKANIEYTGTLNSDNTISGVFIQNGNSLPLNLSRTKIEKKEIVRAQEPKKPYPYYSEEITFKNEKDTISLVGTLTLPSKEGNFPVVILISGSGPQNRDEQIAGHKPFLIISDYLTRNGIAVLRYDDRGTGKSTGKFADATTENLATDVESAVSYLKKRKEINKNKIGLIGHSEGGIIAPLVASRSNSINFIVMLAGTGFRGDKLLLLQEEYQGRAKGEPEDMLQMDLKISKGAYDIVLNSSKSTNLKEELTKYYMNAYEGVNIFDKPKAMSLDVYVQSLVNQFTGVWMQNFIKHDPTIALSKVKCSVLAINGSKDTQVPSKENLEAIKIALERGGNSNATIKELPGLNHLFQECQKGTSEEYSIIEQTFSPEALNEVNAWIQTIIDPKK